MNEDWIGKVALCSKGTLGLITHRKVLPWGESWVGISLHDGSPWASRHPCSVLWEDVVSLSESKVKEEGND